MTLEESRKAEIANEWERKVDDFTDLQSHPAWLHMVEKAHKDIDRLLSDLKSPKSNIEEMRFTQGQLQSLGGMLTYVKRMSALKAGDIQKTVDAQYIDEVARKAREEVEKNADQ